MSLDPPKGEWSDAQPHLGPHDLAVNPPIEAASDIFDRFGGLVLGLKLAAQFSIREPSLYVPGFLVYSPASGRIELIYEPQTPATSWSGAVLKKSGTVEGFTLGSRRGVNSSDHNPRLPAGSNRDLGHLTGLLSELARSMPEARALVVQEYADVSTGCNVVVHCSEELCTVEVVYKHSMHLFDISRNKQRYAEACGTAADLLYVESVAGLSQLALAHFALRDWLGFDVNTEGYPSASGYQIIQLRPVPVDDHSSTQVSIDSTPGSVWNTRFVWGAFDETDIVASDFPSVESSASDAHCLSRIVAPIRARSEERGEDEVFSVHKALWQTPLYECALAIYGKRTVLLDSERGFYLYHGPDMLPPMKAGRESFRTMHVPRELLVKLSGCQVRVISDGVWGRVIPISQEGSE